MALLKSIVHKFHIKWEFKFINVQTLLLELARIQRYGISEQEIAAARAQQMADAESAYREKDQTYSTVRQPCTLGQDIAP